MTAQIYVLVKKLIKRKRFESFVHKWLSYLNFTLLTALKQSDA